jgi:hypothetical protein
MTTIEITSVGDDDGYTVTLHDAGTTTHHRVGVPSALLVTLGLGSGSGSGSASGSGSGSGDEERLVRMSFEFLLEREPPGSILPVFDLDIIGRYFPEYVATMRRQVGPPAS